MRRAESTPGSFETRLHERMPPLRAFLGSARAIWAGIAISLLLTSVCLTLGRTLDDYLQQVMMREPPNLGGLSHRSLDLFAFVQTPSDVRGLVDEGVFQWFSDETAKIALFRPLSSLTHWLDEALWPNSLFAMHLHSMVWYALLLGAVAALERRFTDHAWIGGLAFLLYALDDARGTPVGWLCNRNGLIASFFAFSSLVAYERSRREGSRLAMVCGPVLLGIGLFSGEAAVQVIGYFAAYFFCLDQGTLRQRVLSLIPYALVTIGWRAVYVSLHFGTHHSGLYFDPADVPLDFAHGLLTRLPLLFLAEFFAPYSDLWDLFPVLLPAAQPATLLLAAIVLPCLFLLFRPLWQRDPYVRFWALGMLLATLPACGAPPNDRLLMATSLGGAALLARLFAAMAEQTYPSPGRFARDGTRVLALVHLVIAPLSLPARTWGASALEGPITRAVNSIPSTPDIRDKTVVVLNPAFDTFGCFFQVYRAAKNTPRPHSLRWLASGASALQVSRLDANTLRVRPSDGFLASSVQRMLRSPHKLSFVGEQFVLSDATFTVRSVTDDERPLEVDVRFVEPLESPRLLWYQWGKHEYVPFVPPRVGESLMIPAVDVAQAMFGGV
ncbi:MAG: hypothetical protein JWN04_1694 [Myxococcaceae bacterium]|nr:hypothetical protein [Myxococcaceae bacterium]